ncbi:MAG: energy transducer TonB [Sulfuritalea sp.]|nr:energy transducer TonB [Sulfuritalea sp.]
MPLHFALLLSLSLHAVLIIAPSWQATRLQPFPEASIDARLIPQTPDVAPADTVSTEPSKTVQSASPPTVAPPRKLQGSALRRAQASLTEHLYYPLEAIERGLEGEVILLLQLSEDGRVVSASIARSSGHVLLDQAALEAARRIGALPGSPRQSLFPVNFRLE